MRRAITLLELLVVIGIVGVLVGLLIPAVQKVREAALMIKSQNNQKQILLGLHQYAEAHNGELPACVDFRAPDYFDPLIAILPYVERDDYLRIFKGLSADPSASRKTPITLYKNPLDRSANSLNPKYDFYTPEQLPVSSYAFNAQFFAFDPQIAQQSDGLSQTIWLAEHYAWNCNGTTFLFACGIASHWTIQPATFAHGGPVYGRPKPGDYYPNTSGNPPTSLAADGKTFQVRPTIPECDPRLPNASSARGLQVAFGDGSVRILAPGIAPAVFWGAVTPHGGEVIALD